MKKLDLAYGNPAFLHPYWDEKTLKLPQIKSFTHSYTYDGIPELKDAIVKLHKQETNASTINRYIVVGNGAGQVLSSAIHALNSPVFAAIPHFQRFPFYAKNAGYPWMECYNPDFTQIITCPNNPDNFNEYHDYGCKKIFDLSYNWRTYTDPIFFDEDIMIFSLSKSLGMASARIGWALVRDKKIAEKMRDYIEYNTGGVSIYSQMEAVDHLSSQLYDNNKIFDYGRIILRNRWCKIFQAKPDFIPLNINGQFLWGLGNPPPNVEVVEGKKFGANDSFFRINLGCSNKHFETLLCYLQKK